jgi:hypothetical protein
MSGISKKLMSAAGAGGEALAIEDVFSTYLYTGNGSTQTITNGIDLAGEGGLVWIKDRSFALNHTAHDTEQGATKYLTPNDTDIAFTTSGFSFNSDGFTVGSLANDNRSGDNFASWTFRKAPRFFDVVTYTGNSTSGRTIAHNLGVTPGFIVVKRTNLPTDWIVLHRNDGTTSKSGWLNYTDSFNNRDSAYFSADPNDTDFYLGSSFEVNRTGDTYVAYLFAHDPLGPSGDGSDGLIACGSFTDSSSGWSVDLGFEPQFLLTKRTDSAGNWEIVDTVRDFTADRIYTRLYPNLSNAEQTVTKVGVNSTGFFSTTAMEVDGATIIYIAIRRGPMRAPTSGTEVFAIDTMGGTAPTPPTYNSGFPVDFAMQKGTHGTSGFANTRLLSGTQLVIDSTGAENAFASSVFDYMNGWRSYVGVDSRWHSWMFRRAPEFFDAVAYSGDGVARAVPHNLGVAPELMLVKRRDSAENWQVYSGALGALKRLKLNRTDSADGGGETVWNNTAPTDLVFSLGENYSEMNLAGATYIAYLFATLAGVSKVGSYTGNGTSQTINCGFTTGARFILIKRADSTGDWYVWDTARGIVTGNDPHLSLNTTAAEVTTDDSIDPDSSGFIVNQVAATNINVSSASYIFMAIS